MADKQSFFKRAALKIKHDNEKGARQSLLEELFYDFHRSRAQVYKMNFFRGIFFAAGTVIGGTVVIALLVWLLSLLGAFIPPLGDFFDGLSQTIEAGRKR